MSPTFAKIRRYYDTGLWCANTVRLAVTKNWITQAECDLILNGEGEQDDEAEA